MILTAPQVATLKRALAAANQALPRIEMLEQLGQHSSGIRAAAQELRTKREYIVQLATSTLEIDRQIGGSEPSVPAYAAPPPLSVPVTIPEREWLVGEPTDDQRYQWARANRVVFFDTQAGRRYVGYPGEQPTATTRQI
jgi:hypothetical protein